MSIFSSLFGASPSGKFAFADGRTLSPEQFGFVAVKNSYQSASEDVRDLFSDSQPAADLAVARAIRLSGLSAAMYMGPLYTACYIAHAASLPNTNSSVIDRVMVGVRDSWADFKFADGRPLPTGDVDHLAKATRYFTATWAKDLETIRARDAAAFHPALLPSIAAMVEMLHTNLNDGSQRLDSWKQDMQSGGGVWLSQMLEASLLSVTHALINPLRVTYA
jgi:hypothetical protein